jgi:hypothetical protein
MRLGRRRTLLRYPYEVRSAEEYFNEIGAKRPFRTSAASGAGRATRSKRKGGGCLPPSFIHVFDLLRGLVCLASLVELKFQSL